MVARVCSVSRAAAEGSAIAVTATSSESEIARRWLRPMRPAPSSPNLNVASSEASLGKEAPVGPLVGGRRPAGLRQRVLLDHDPARVRVADRVEDRVDVQVAVAETAECLALPDLRHRGGLADDLLDHGPPRVL